MEIIIKELAINELDSMSESFFETLSNLKPSKNLSLDESKNILSKIISQDGHILVAIDKELNEIVGCLTVLIEQKFIRGGGKCSHIEDVSTRKGHEGKGIGSMLMKEAVKLSKDLNCYKIILDCEESLVKYYEKFGFSDDGTFMRLYLDK